MLRTLIVMSAHFQHMVRRGTPRPTYRLIWCMLVGSRSMRMCATIITQLQDSEEETAQRCSRLLKRTLSASRPRRSEPGRSDRFTDLSTPSVYLAFLHGRHAKYLVQTSSFGIAKSDAYQQLVHKAVDGRQMERWDIRQETYKLGGLGGKERRKVRVLLSKHIGINDLYYKCKGASLNVASGGVIQKGKRDKYLRRSGRRGACGELGDSREGGCSKREGDNADLKVTLLENQTRFAAGVPRPIFIHLSSIQKTLCLFPPYARSSQTRVVGVGGRKPTVLRLLSSGIPNWRLCIDA